MNRAAVQMQVDVREAIATIRRFVADCETRKRTIGDVPDEELAELIEQIREGVRVAVPERSVQFSGPVNLYGTPHKSFIDGIAKGLEARARTHRRTQ